LDEIKEWALAGDERRRIILRNASQRKQEYQAAAPDWRG
jgi:predicted Fe-S protein YdhL (DUF1289 family)